MSAHRTSRSTAVRVSPAVARRMVDAVAQLRPLVAVCGRHAWLERGGTAPLVALAVERLEGQLYGHGIRQLQAMRRLLVELQKGET